MKSNIYFDNVPTIGTLFMEQILFSFESIPMIFVCTDDIKNRFPCVCDDIIDEESWLIVKISTSKLLDILNDVSTVLTAFKGEKVIIANRGFKRGIEYSIMKYEDINKDDLPVCDQFLEMKDHLKTYIEKIESEFISINFKLPISSYEVFNDQLNISISQSSTFEERIRTVLCINTSRKIEIDEIIECFSDNSFSVQLDCKVSREVSNNLDNSSEEILVFAA